MNQCTRCKELSDAADEVLDHLANLTRNQLAAFREGNTTRFMALDKELELVVGLKERSIGALREHRRGHAEGVVSQASAIVA
jgi:hypothetical protein